MKLLLEVLADSSVQTENPVELFLLPNCIQSTSNNKWAQLFYQSAHAIDPEIAQLIDTPIDILNPANELAFSVACHGTL